MQDKNEHPFQEWEDRGWEEMRQLLDREMPVAIPVRKRRMWVLLSAAGLLLAGWLASRATYSSSAPVPMPVAGGGFRVDHAGRPEAFRSGTDLPEAAPSTLGVVGNGEGGRITPASLSIRRKSLWPSPQIGTPQAAVLPAVRQPVDSILSDPRPGMRVAGHPPLPSLRAIGVVSGRLRERPLVPSQPFGRRSGHVRTTGLYGGGMVGDAYGSIGMAMGWQWGWRKPGTPWQLEAGIGYSFQQRSLSIAYVADAGAGMSAQTAAPGSIPSTRVTLGRHSTNAQTYSVQALLVDGIVRPLDLHYLEVPVMAGYRLGPMLSVAAGATVGVLLASRSEQTEGGIFRRLARGTADEHSVSRLEDFQQLSAAGPSERLRNLDLAVFGGLEIGRPKGLAVRLAWQQGLSDLLPDNGHAGDKSSLLRTSLLYRF